MQKVLTLIITAAVIYMIFKQSVSTMSVPEHIKNLTPKQLTGQEASVEQSGNFIEKTISTVLLNILKTDEGKLFLETMIQPMNKPLAGSGASFEMNSDKFMTALFHINTFGIGEKGPASCGHIATIQYKILSMDNKVLEENITTFPLGSNKITPGLDAIIVGMKTGQTRHATISSKYFHETSANTPEFFKVNVLLKELVPQNFVDDSVKIFDSQLAYKIPMLCGGRAVYNAKITDLSASKVIYNSADSGKKISMQIGNLSYPMIFSHALHNKIAVGTRTVITKGRFLKSYASDYSTIFPTTKLQDDAFYMVDFSDFEDQLPVVKTGVDHLKQNKKE